DLLERALRGEAHELEELRPRGAVRPAIVGQDRRSKPARDLLLPRDGLGRVEEDRVAEARVAAHAPRDGAGGVIRVRSAAAGGAPPRGRHGAPGEHAQGALAASAIELLVEAARRGGADDVALGALQTRRGPDGRRRGLGPRSAAGGAAPDLGRAVPLRAL